MEKNKPYILHITSWYPSKVNVFDGDFVQRHIECIHEYKHCVIHAQQINRMHHTVIKHGTMSKTSSNDVISYIIYYKPLFRLVNPLYQFVYLYILWQQVKKEYGIPLLLHVHVMIYGILLGRVLKNKYALPLIVTEHSTLYTSEEKRPFEKFRIWFSRYLSTSANMILPVSHHLAKALKSVGFKNEMQVVHNVVPDIFRKDKLSTNCNDGIRFLHVSTLDDEQKNVKGILRSMSRVMNHNDNCTMTIVGNDRIKETQALIDTYGFDLNKIILEGPLSHLEVAKLMKEHDVFVLFSNYENYPCVLIEAQTAGMRLIASDVGGISEILDDKEDILIDKRDEKALEKAMLKCIADSQRKDVKQLSKAENSRYSPYQVGNQIVGIYKKYLD